MYPVKVAEELSDTEEPEQEPLNVVTMDPNSAEQVIAAYETDVQKSFDIQEYTSETNLKRLKVSTFLKTHMTMGNVIAAMLLSNTVLIFYFLFCQTIPDIIHAIQTRNDYDQIVNTRSATFFFIGKPVIAINGSQFEGPSGITEYEVTLPSYNITWEPSFKMMKVFAEVDPRGGYRIPPNQTDVHDCNGDGKWCVTVTTNHTIRSPVLVTYTLLFAPRGFDFEMFSFNRTFYIRHWSELSLDSSNFSLPI